jgi:hypothetical protein
MQKRKTRFEQVPIEAAENALRQQTNRPRTVANRSLLLRNPVPIRVGRRRLLRRRIYLQLVPERIN